MGKRLSDTICRGTIPGYIPFNWAYEKYELSDKTLIAYIKQNYVASYTEEKTRVRMVSEVDVRRCVAMRERAKARAESSTESEDKIAYKFAEALSEYTPVFYEATEGEYDRFEAKIKRILSGFYMHEKELEKEIEVLESATVMLLSVLGECGIERPEVRAELEKIESKIEGERNGKAG